MTVLGLKKQVEQNSRFSCLETEIITNHIINHRTASYGRRFQPSWSKEHLRHAPIHPDILPVLKGAIFETELDVSSAQFGGSD